jgi:formylglycine-generating enzyme required for sulfatase activity
VRAGTTSVYSFDPWNDGYDRYAWHEDNSGRKTHPVGQKEPNPWGLYDVHGNVLEWVQDWFDGDYYSRSPEIDPRGPSEGKGRVLRGGSWNHNAGYMRSAHRRFNPPEGRSECYGFRLAFSPSRP